jgi:hypothetical protein
MPIPKRKQYTIKEMRQGERDPNGRFRLFERSPTNKRKWVEILPVRGSSAARPSSEGRARPTHTNDGD